MIFMADGAPPTWIQSCLCRKMAIVAAIDWAAIIAWISSTNWVGVITVGGAVALTGTLAIINIITHVQNARIKWAADWEKAQEKTLGKQLEDLQGKLAEVEKNRAEDMARAAEERQDLKAKITEHAEQRKAILDEMTVHTASMARERESIHAQRNEMQKSANLQIEESVYLRKQLAETTRELTLARKEIDGLRREVDRLTQGTQRQVKATERVAEQVEQLRAATSNDNIPIPPELGGSAA